MCCLIPTLEEVHIDIWNIHCYSESTGPLRSTDITPLPHYYETAATCIVSSRITLPMAMQASQVPFVLSLILHSFRCPLYADGTHQSWVALTYWFSIIGNYETDYVQGLEFRTSPCSRYSFRLLTLRRDSLTTLQDMDSFRHHWDVFKDHRTI